VFQDVCTLLAHAPPPCSRHCSHENWHWLMCSSLAWRDVDEAGALSKRFHNWATYARLAAEIDDELTANSAVNHSSSMTGQVRGRRRNVRSDGTHLSGAVNGDVQSVTAEPLTKAFDCPARNGRGRPTSVWQIVCRVSWLVLAHFEMSICCRRHCFEEEKTFYGCGKTCHPQYWQFF